MKHLLIITAYQCMGLYVCARARARVCRFHIIRNACKTLAHALIRSRLDYGNALLYGIPGTLMARLQRVQNCAARLLTRTRKRQHITPVLNSLHWLPVIYRSKYKILVYAYKTLNVTAPRYLEELLFSLSATCELLVTVQQQQKEIKK